MAKSCTGWKRLFHRNALPLVATLVLTQHGFLSAEQPAVQQKTRNDTKLPDYFEVVSIRPVPQDSVGTLAEPQGLEFRAKAMPLSVLVQMAFGINPRNMVIPDWASDVKFDIAATTGSTVPLTYEQMKPRLQQMLTERFGMAYHLETRERSGYDMVAAKSGLKLVPAKPEETKGGSGGPRSIVMPNTTMQGLAEMLTVRLESPVRDETGATGNYEVHLQFAREDDTDTTLPTLLTALEEELGIKLIRSKLPVQMVVIDHLERTPTAN